MKILSEAALQGISSYEYKPGTYTWLDLQMNHFWTWIVEFVPLTIAPNMLTLTGTFSILISTALLGYYSPQLNSEVPSWVFLVCGVALFVYQTLDAIDGKQARRTKSSSPLGQLFDHGCDALCTVLNMLCAIGAIGLGPSLTSFFVLSLTAFAFFLAQWQEYHTGHMCSGNGYIGVTEGQIVLMAIHFITACTGVGFWRTPVFLQYSIAQVLVCLLISSSTILIAGNFTAVLGPSARIIKRKKDIGNKRISKGDAIQQLFPVVALLIGGGFWIAGPDEPLYQKTPIMYLTAVGVGFVLLASRMIVAHMCKIPCGPQLRSLFPLAVLLANCYCPILGLADDFALEPVNASSLFSTYTITVYLHYTYHVMHEICEHLEINLLTLSEKKND